MDVRVQATLWAIVLVVLGFIAARSFGGASDVSHGQRVRLDDGRHILLNCSGEGSPTVLLEGGFAATSSAWFKVQPAIARLTKVCSYDRAGYGQSDFSPLPRDGTAIASDLDATLKKAGVIGPFVVVGHSSGALYVRVFSDLRPKDVVGMVLVDPSVEYQDKRFASRFGAGAGSVARLRERAVRCLDAAESGSFPSDDPLLKPCVAIGTKPQARDIDNWRTQISELDCLWQATSAEVAEGRQSYGDMPLVVLTADGTFGGLPATRAIVEDFWSQLHKEIAQRSTRGREELVSGSSHMMMFDRPDAIEAAVTEVVGAVRHNRAANGVL